MVMSSTQSEICLGNPEIGNHVFEKDEEDKRFKVCILCGCVEYRTDEEVLKNEPR